MRRPILLAGASILSSLSAVGWLWTSQRSPVLDLIVFNASLNITTAPWRLHSSRYYAVEVNHDGHWTAFLEDKQNGVKIPIHRSPAFGEEKHGHFIVPSAGGYELVFRTWPPVYRQDVETEPNFCYLVRWRKDDVGLPPYDSRLMDLLSINPALDVHCAKNETRPADQVRLADPPLGLATRTVRRLQFRAGSVDEPTRSSEISKMFAAVYRGYESTVAGGAALAAGYWSRLDEFKDETTPMLFGPDRHECPFLVSTDTKPVCFPAYPPYRWTGLVEQGSYRHPSIATDLSTCLEKRAVLVLGDSLAAQLQHGLQCQQLGMPQSQPRAYACGAQTASVVLFSSRDMGPAITYEDYLAIFNSCKEGKPETTDLVYQIGHWIIPYVPSSDWTRGLQRLAQYAVRHSHETGVKHWFSTLTPVNVQDDIHTYTSPQRVALWNRKVFAVAAQHGLPVIDNTAPLDSREDARLDRLHMCHQLVGEWAYQVFGTICGHSITRGS